MRETDELSPRESEILAAVAAGERTRDIAARLRLSENTVKSHLTHIYRKTGSRSRVEAARHYLDRQAPSANPRNRPAIDAKPARPSADIEPEQTLIDRQVHDLRQRLHQLERTAQAAEREADEIRQALDALAAIRKTNPRPSGR